MTPWWVGKVPCRDRLLLVQSFCIAAIAGQSVLPAAAVDSPASELSTDSNDVERRLQNFNCQEGQWNLRSHWTDQQKGYCCETQNVGCDDDHMFDCAAGLANWNLGWSAEKKTWCCKHKSLGCTAGKKPHDCEAGLWNYKIGWSSEKKKWCCEHEKKGCTVHSNDPFYDRSAGAKPYNCQEGLWNFRKGWSVPKKEWCCANEHLGCEGRPDVQIVEDTNKPVAKCHGKEKAYAACHAGDCETTCEPEDCQFGSWSEWSSMGSCYGLCQRERRIVTTNNECGRPCAGPRVMTKGGSRCQPDDSCGPGGNVDCIWEDWSDWSQTCVNVDIDQSTRWRKVAVEPSLDGKSCKGAFNETRACEHLKRKDCQLSTWGQWTKCSASCQGGTQSRLRQIEKFAAFGGKPCATVLREAKACNNEVCPGELVCTLSAWSPWQGCSQVMSQRFRKRSVEEVPQSHGKDVFCEFNLLETAGCPKVSSEPNVCQLTQWADWGVCSADCGGSRVRNRSIHEADQKTCHAYQLESLSEIEACGESPPCNGKPCQLGTWTKWSPCSHRCGPGVTDRKREVQVGGNCDSLLKEVKGCMVAPCIPQNCEWGEWVFWSTCSRTCGGGEKRRHRVVSRAPRHGGLPCDPEVSEEVAMCNNNTCDTCVDGQWGEWSHWGECSSTCAPAFKVRHRDQTTFPNHCGQPALGLEDDYEMCDDVQECSNHYDCLMSSWGQWSDCSCKCFGVAERSRRIVRTAAGNGKPCLGSMKEIVPCHPRFGQQIPEECIDQLSEGDCKLSEWDTWSLCTATCDGGQTSRTRTVVTPNKPGGQPCNDTLSEVHACGVESCGASACQDCIWGPWGQWGECSKCGGQRYRHRQIEKMPNYCGRTCEPGAAKEVDECKSHCADAAYCVWTDWQDASQCSSACGHASRLRERHLTMTERRPMWGGYLFKSTVGAPCSGTQVEAALCKYQSCGPNEHVGCAPVDCVFGEWNMWSEPSCTQLCSRNRVMRVVSSCGGTPCHGATVETKHCVKSDCRDAQDCKFSDWHAWSSICVDDQKSRIRVIERPQSNGGDPCCGPLKETMPCEGTEMPNLAVQDGEASPWSAWSQCSRRCGGGVQTRSRAIKAHAQNGGYPFCGALDQLKPCNEDACTTGDGGKPCVLSHWDDWGECKDMNMQYRNRRILQEADSGGQSCEDGLRLVRQCTFAVDCKVCEWTRWTDCSRTCGGGQTTRHRQVTKNPRFGGKECPIELIQTSGCNDAPCSPDDAQVSAWAEWGACDVDCGIGQRSRIRFVTSPPKEDGIGFYGPLSETTSCLERECGSGPQDCVWGQWSSWTTCDHPCGGGQKHRERRIARVPRNGGKLCPAMDKEETMPCNAQACTDGHCIDGQWDDWSEWEPCSSTCNGGVTWRTRSVRVEANYCGISPLGLSVEHEGCNMAVKCNPNQDCRFGEWHEWGHCTMRCYGVKERIREILQHGRGDGNFCKGPLRQTRPCAEDAGCPHAGTHDLTDGGEDCKLSEWSSWGTCDRQCGMGQMVRMRQLKKPGRHGGKDCAADLAQVGPCSLGPCHDSCVPENCRWSQWQQWSACDQCDGQMRRHRYVKQHAKCGGRQCSPGDAEQVEKCPRFCHAQSYCGWSDWQSWSRCSASCGSGRQERTRELRPMLHPPNAPKVIQVPYQCHEGLENYRAGWSDEKKRWCCENMRLGCENDNLQRNQQTFMSKFELLQQRTAGLEDRRVLHLATAWAAGALSLLTGYFVLRAVRRSATRSTEGFQAVPS